MKAVIVNGDQTLRLADDVPEPTLGPYDCRVSVEAFSFCNSTDQYIAGNKPPLQMAYPAILGHESVGVITDIGERVNNFRVGDRVLRAYAEYPGKQIGNYHLAWGSFAEFGKVRDLVAMRADGHHDEADATRYLAYQQSVPPTISPAEALLMIPWKEMYSALGGVDHIAGHRFLVTGAGIVALCFGYLLRQRGAEHVALIARRPEPLAKAIELDAADEVLLADQPIASGKTFDAMIETTGSMAFATSLLGHIRKDGTIYAYAIYPEMSEKDTYKPFESACRFKRIDPSEAEAHDDVCELVRNGRLPCNELITHKFPINQLQEAWRTVTDRQTLKTIVYF